MVWRQLFVTLACQLMGMIIVIQRWRGDAAAPTLMMLQQQLQPRRAPYVWERQWTRQSGVTWVTHSLHQHLYNKTVPAKMCISCLCNWAKVTSSKPTNVDASAGEVYSNCFHKPLWANHKNANQNLFFETHLMLHTCIFIMDIDLLICISGASQIHPYSIFAISR